MIDDVINKVAVQLEISRAIIGFAGELNIARRNWAAYPPGHPVVESSLQKLDRALQELLKNATSINLGITREGLLLEDDFIEKGNPICKSLAAALFERGIGTIVFRKAASSIELSNMLMLLAMKREEILKQGGIETLWQDANITAIDVIGIRYDRFSGTEVQTLEHNSDNYKSESTSENIWEQLAKSMMQGDSNIRFTKSENYRGEISPELLAETLNARYIKAKLRSGEDQIKSLTKNSLSIIRDIISSEKEQFNYGNNSAGNHINSYQDGLLNFFKTLDPRLRRQILDGFCEIGGNNNPDTEELASSLGAALLQETYATAQEYSKAPPLLQDILRKLLPHSSEIFETVTPIEEIKKKIKTLLIEHDQEAYIPEDYFNDLKDIIADTSFTPVKKEELAVFIKTLDPSVIEARSSEIILQLVITDTGGGDSEKLIQNLSEMCDHFLELGEYDQVLKILSQAADPRFPQELRTSMRQAFSRPEFLEEALSGLTIWGKSKYDHVVMLIRIIGRPFIEPLLNRLAAEDNMSLRRFMMDRILVFGDTAVPHLVKRLSDNRWYVLRNIITMLRTLAPGEVSDHLRPLLKHSNQKVRHEVLKSLLISGDHIAQRMILRDLDSTDQEVLLSAIHLSDKNSPTEVVKKLLSILTKGGFSPVECEVKSACVQALSDIGRPDILPELGKVLGSRSLMAFKALNRLKIDIVRSLEKYPANASIPILQKLAKGSDDISKQASDGLKNLRGKS